MAATCWPAQGVTIAIDESYPPSGTYALIGEVISIGHAGGGEVGERDGTVLTSGVKFPCPTIPDKGEVDVETNFDPTDSVHKFLRNLADVPPALPYTSNNFKTVFNTGPTTSSVVFPAWVKTFDGPTAGGVEENLKASIKLRVNGFPSWTAAT